MQILAWLQLVSLEIPFRRKVSAPTIGITFALNAESFMNKYLLLDALKMYYVSTFDLLIGRY